MKTFLKAFAGVICALGLAQLVYLCLNYKRNYEAASAYNERLAKQEEKYREAFFKEQKKTITLTSKVERLTSENKRLSDDLEFARLAAVVESDITATPLPLTRPRATSSPSDFLPTDARLPNGMIVEDRFGRKGKGTLIIQNGTDGDAYIKVIDPVSRRRVAGFYARAHSDASFEGIPDGSYSIVYAIGYDWSWPKLDFVRSRKAYRFDGRFDFKTTRRTEGTSVFDYFSKNTLTLHKVVGGNVQTSEISVDEFDKY